MLTFMIHRAVQLKINKALRLFADEKFQEAEKLCKEILIVEKKSVIALNLLGVLSDKKGQFHNSLESFEAAIEADPTYVDSYSNAANVLGKLSRFEEAISFVREPYRSIHTAPAAPITI